MLAKSGDMDNGYAALGQMRAAEQQFDLQWLELEGDNPLAERPLPKRSFAALREFLL